MFKSFVLFLHRWLGLLTGLVVLILSITGCLFVFQQEISEWVRHDTYHVDNIPAEKQTLPLKQLQAKAASALEVDHLPYGLTTYKDPSKNWSALLYKAGVDSWTYFGSMEYYKTAYINPYTGKIEGIVNEKQDFFQIVKGIHWSLLLHKSIGQPILAWSTLIFIVLMISGMILWWPKKWSKAGRKKSFTIKWGSSWRRVNYDLHNVLGFYFLALSLIVAFTGLYWYFPFAQKTLHFLGNGEYKLPQQTVKKVSAPAPNSADSLSAMRVAYQQSWKQYPEAYSIAIASPTDSTSPISATIRPNGETYYGRSYLQFDQNTGRIIATNRYEDKNAGEKLNAMNYDIHVGAIGGLPGKIIAFIVSLICGSLPVTGFIIWWDRKRREWKSRKRMEQQAKKLSASEERMPV